MNAQGKIHWWQRLLSYMVDVPIETLRSDDHDTLQISLVRNRFQLSTEKSIYSFDDLYLNFLRAFRKVELPPDGANVLLLGLGLGSVPFMLESVFEKDYQITAVELDETVIELASKYTLPRLRNKVMVVHADAAIYLQVDINRYDMIIVDVFIEDIIPGFFEQTKGLKQIKERLLPNGMLLYNRLYRTKRDKELTEKFYNEVFLKVFKEGSRIDVDGNWILKN